MKVGDSLAEWRLDSVSPDAMADLAVILRDPNPIHLDRAAVARAGLGDRRINQGPANLAYIVNMLTAAFPGGRIAKLHASFVSNAFEGEAVVAGGVVTAVEAGRVSCDTWLRAGARDIVTAKAEIMPNGDK